MWYLRPPDSGDKLSSRWIGPAKVDARKEKNSYQIAVKPGFLMGAHRGALKAYTPDSFRITQFNFFIIKGLRRTLRGPPTSSFWKKFLGMKRLGEDVFQG